MPVPFGGLGFADRERGAVSVSLLGRGRWVCEHPPALCRPFGRMVSGLVTHGLEKPSLPAVLGCPPA